MPARSTPRRTPPPAQMVQFSNVGKVMFPESGITKGQILEFYLKVAAVLIPHLRDRPITLERMPDGVGEGKPRFWQKNTPPYYPKWIRRVTLPGDEKKVQYALVNDVETLAYLVNQGAITFHPFLSRVQDLDRPDYVIFDLDPGGSRFTDVVKIAVALHKILESMAVKSFPKTSGKSGLHVLVPWTQKGDFETARAWAEGVASQVVAKLPDIATTERMKAARGVRVYVDVVQNWRAKHIVPPYVVRPTPTATVSTPLQWKEVNAKLDPRKFTIKTVPKRVAAKGDLMGDVVGR